MPLGQRRRRRSVADLLSQSSGPVRSRDVVDGDGGFVATPPTGLVESPDEVDVFTETQRPRRSRRRRRRPPPGPRSQQQGRSSRGSRREHEPVRRRGRAPRSGRRRHVVRRARPVGRRSVGVSRSSQSSPGSRDVGIDERDQWASMRACGRCCGQRRSAVAVQADRRRRRVGGTEPSSTVTSRSARAVPPSCGVITVTSRRVTSSRRTSVGCGWIAPASSRRATSDESATSSPDSIERQTSAPAAVSRNTRSGEPASTTRPDLPVRFQVPSVPNRIVSRGSGSTRRRGSARRGPPCAGHRPHAASDRSVATARS